MKPELPHVEILSFKTLEPTKPYPDMDEYGDTLKLKISAELYGVRRNFVLYEMVDGNEDNLCYVIFGNSKKLDGQRSKDFCYDDNGVFFSAWGVSWKRDKRHKFDEDEVEKISKITGFRYAYKPEKRGFVVYVYPKRVPLLTDKLNNDLIKRLIIGWLACWEIL
ncbi:hypothetical protein AFULGI_00006060 [Archaeoglobus fulgidus DSM 8774]|uniref:Uncharacterized protein n=1 Tax=Archaeoglobus fulgidus DSM 8774 TaxID=1344584 RepID=A0A075WCU3_ARCFL|nr:hypothetical protein [Archaeoglobus fulgidus]AIG97407.1 hypothetical protein AFULGI_00006060 [Archaeoglobus fulgidus DSM 8774]